MTDRDTGSLVETCEWNAQATSLLFERVLKNKKNIKKIHSVSTDKKKACENRRTAPVRDSRVGLIAIVSLRPSVQYNYRLCGFHESFVHGLGKYFFVDRGGSGLKSSHFMEQKK